MKDIRFRILSGAILSVAAFLSLTGAAAAFIWWLIFTRRLDALPRIPVIAGSGAMIGIIALILQIQGGFGISYGCRMGVILLIAAWIWSEHRPGEYLALGVWMLKERPGFELGMTAELGMQAFQELLCDLERLKAAWALKGTRLSVRCIPAAGLVLVSGALKRAQDTAELLAVRGYRSGGTYCPVFRTPPGDLLGCAGALVAMAVALIPVGEFFILPW